MGLSFSSPPPGANLTVVEVGRIVDAAKRHQFQAMTDLNCIPTLFRAAAISVDDERRINRAIEACQHAFRDDFTIYTHEVLAALALTCRDAPWEARAHMLFHVFSGAGTEEMGHEDFMLAAQVVAVALSRLWDTPRWCSQTTSKLTEALADSAFLKMEKEIDEGIDRATFVQWVTRRFPETATVVSLEALRGLYQQPS